MMMIMIIIICMCNTTTTVCFNELSSRHEFIYACKLGYSYRFKIAIFWNMTPCILAYMYQRFPDDRPFNMYRSQNLRSHIIYIYMHTYTSRVEVGSNTSIVAL
jgi:hypothetical protein